MRTKLGFIGAGKMAQAHAKAARHLGAEIVCVAASSPQSDNLKAFAQAAPDVAIVGDPWGGHGLDVDAWVVATPWSVTPQLAEQLFARPEPMLIEKPVSLHDRAFASGPHEDNKFIAFNRRFYEPVQRLAADVDLSDVKSVTVTLSDAFDNVVGRYGEAVLPYTLDMWSSHVLDLVIHVFGDVDVAWGSAVEEPRGYCNVEAVLTTADRNIPIHVSVNADDPSPVGLRVRMNDGIAYVLAPTEKLSIYKGLEVVDVDGCRSYRPRQTDDVECAEDGFKAGFLNQMRAFLHDDRTILASVSEARLTHNLIKKLREVPCRDR